MEVRFVQLQRFVRRLGLRLAIHANATDDVGLDEAAVVGLHERRRQQVQPVQVLQLAPRARVLQRVGKLTMKVAFDAEENRQLLLTMDAVYNTFF